MLPTQNIQYERLEPYGLGATFYARPPDGDADIRRALNLPFRHHPQSLVAHGLVPEVYPNGTVERREDGILYRTTQIPYDQNLACEILSPHDDDRVSVRIEARLGFSDRGQIVSSIVNYVTCVLMHHGLTPLPPGATTDLREATPFADRPITVPKRRAA